MTRITIKRSNILDQNFNPVQNRKIKFWASTWKQSPLWVKMEFWECWMFVCDGLWRVISHALRLYLPGWQFAPIFLIGSRCTDTLDLDKKTFWNFCNNLNFLKFRQKHLPRFARDSLSQSCWLAPGAQTHLTKKQAHKTQPKSQNAPVFFNDRWNAGRISVKIRRERHLGNLVGQVYDEEKNQIIMIKMWPTIVVSYDLMHNKSSQLETSKDFLFSFLNLSSNSLDWGCSSSSIWS